MYYDPKIVRKELSLRHTFQIILTAKMKNMSLVTLIFFRNTYKQASVPGHMRIPGNEEAKTEKYPTTRPKQLDKKKPLKIRKEK
jgi:hypothetical protein